MSSSHRVLGRAFDEANSSLNVTVVAQVSAASAHPTVVNLDENGVWAKVFDEATGTLRVVEVI